MCIRDRNKVKHNVHHAGRHNDLERRFGIAAAHDTLFAQIIEMCIRDRRYRDKNDFALGEWIVYNRQRYLGGNLTQNRIERLEAIGMVWSTSNDLWEQNYAAATQYYLEHGDLEVPIKYETPSGFGLGVWLGAQRAAHKAGELPQEQVERLDALGMDWTCLLYTSRCV